MLIHPALNHVGGVVTVSLQAQFVGDPTDNLDLARIQAYGDPTIDLGGTFIDPTDSTFKFVLSHSGCSFPVKLTTEMHQFTIQFMRNAPEVAPACNRLPWIDPQLDPFHKPVQGPLQVFTPDPARAAAVWREVIVTRISNTMSTFRALPDPAFGLPDVTI
jgi:hypothetical protein